MRPAHRCKQRHPGLTLSPGYARVSPHAVSTESRRSCAETAHAHRIRSSARTTRLRPIPRPRRYLYRSARTDRTLRLVPGAFASRAGGGCGRCRRRNGDRTPLPRVQPLVLAGSHLTHCIRCGGDCCRPVRAPRPASVHSRSRRDDASVVCRRVRDAAVLRPHRDDAGRDNRGARPCDCRPSPLASRTSRAARRHHGRIRNAGRGCCACRAGRHRCAARLAVAGPSRRRCRGGLLFHHLRGGRRHRAAGYRSRDHARLATTGISWMPGTRHRRGDRRGPHRTGPAPGLEPAAACRGAALFRVGRVSRARRAARPAGPPSRRGRLARSWRLRGRRRRRRQALERCACWPRGLRQRRCGRQTHSGHDARSDACRACASGSGGARVKDGTHASAGVLQISGGYAPAQCHHPA